MTLCEGRLDRHDQKLQLINRKCDRNSKEIEDLQDKKVDITQEEENRKVLNKKMEKITTINKSLHNQLMTIENYIEKYLPLRMQNQLYQTVNAVLDKRQRTRFSEFNSRMMEQMRIEVFKDTGHSKLKQKCLDLISKLRLEADILNPSKTGRAALVESPYSNEPLDEEEKANLSLDENG